MEKSDFRSVSERVLQRIRSIDFFSRDLTYRQLEHLETKMDELAGLYRKGIEPYRNGSHFLVASPALQNFVHMVAKNTGRNQQLKKLLRAAAREAFPKVTRNIQRIRLIDKGSRTMTVYRALDHVNNFAAFEIVKGVMPKLKENPYEFLMEMYSLGAAPSGFDIGEGYVVFIPGTDWAGRKCLYQYVFDGISPKLSSRLETFNEKGVYTPKK